MNFTNNFRPKGYAKFLLFFLNFSMSMCMFFDQPAVASETIEFKLAWDANTEEDPNGYEIYFRTPNSDYEFIGDVYVDELADPDNPMLTITDSYNGGLPDSLIPVVSIPALAMVDGETYYYAITAFDMQSNISNFSEELCLEVIGSSVVECRHLNSGSSNSADDSGGGGGGCFISTSSNNLKKNNVTQNIFSNVFIWYYDSYRPGTEQ